MPLTKCVNIDFRQLRAVLIIILVIITLMLISCVPGGQSPDDTYLGNSYPGKPGEWLGSGKYPWYAIVGNWIYSWNSTDYQLINNNYDGCLLNRHASTGLIDGYTTVNWTVEKYDVGNLHADNSQSVVIKSTGLYMLTAQGFFYDSSHTDDFRIAIFVNNVEIAEQAPCIVNKSSQMICAVTIPYRLFINDVITVKAFANWNTAILYYVVNINQPAFIVQRIGN